MDRDNLQAEARALVSEALGKDGRYDFAQRARTLGKALGLYREAGEREEQVRVLVALGNAASNVADFAGALDYLHEAEDIVKELDDPSLGRAVRGQLTGVHMDLGDFPEALKLAHREWELDSNSDDAETRLLALNTLGCILAAMGRHEDGIDKINEGAACIDKIENEGRRNHMRAQSMADLSDAFMMWGKADFALSYAEQGAAIAERIEHLPLVMLNSIYAGRAALALRNPALAAQKLELAVDLSRRLGLKSQAFQAHFELANALAELNRHEEALDSYRKGHKIERAIRRDEAARRLEFRRGKKEIDDARREKENAERVLFTVLPEAIATRMKAGEARIADEVRCLGAIRGPRRLHRDVHADQSAGTAGVARAVLLRIRRPDGDLPTREGEDDRGRLHGGGRSPSAPPRSS